MSTQRRLDHCIRLAAERGGAFAFALTGSRADAEDCVQQALLVAVAKAEQIPRFGTWPWFAKVIAHEARNLRRKNATRAAFSLDRSGAVDAPRHAGALDSPLPDPSGADPLEALIRQDLSNRLWLAFSALPEQEREALAAHYVAGMTQRRAAAALGVSRAKLRRLVDSGTEQLRRELGIESRKVLSAALCAAISTKAAAAIGGAAAAHVVISLVGGATMGKYGWAAVVALVLLLAGGAGVWLLGDDGEERERIAAAEDGELVGRVVPQQPKLDDIGGVEDDLPERPQPDAEVPEPIVASIEARAPVNPFFSADGEPIDGQLPGPVSLDGIEWIPVTFRVRGMVRTPSGEAVPKATVRAAPPTQIWTASLPEKRQVRYIVQNFPIRFDGRSEVVSNADGAFELAVNASVTAEARSTRNVTLGLESESEGMVPVGPVKLWWNDFTDTLERDNVVLLMSPPTAVRGVVLDAVSGDPVSGAVVGMRHVRAPRGVNVWTEWTQPADVASPPIVTTDGAGAFAFNGVAAGDWRAYALPPGNSPSQWIGAHMRLPEFPSPAAHDIVVGDGAAIPPVELRLAAPAVLRFRVSPEAESLTIELRNRPVRPDSDLRSAALSLDARPLSPDADGVYVLPGLMIEHIQLVIRPKGFRPTAISIAPIPGRDLDLGTITLDTGAVMRGRVVDSLGGPIGGASIRIAKVDSSQSWAAAMGLKFGFPDAKSQPDGSFEIAGLDEASYLALAELKEMKGRTETVPVRLDGAAEVTLTLWRSASLSGELRVPAGTRPPAIRRAADGRLESSDVYVRIYDLAEPQFQNMNVGEGVDAMNFTHHTADALVDEAWSYRFPALAPGPHLIAAKVGMEAKVLRVEVRDGHTTFDIEFGVGGRIEGVITGVDGTPMAGAIVHAFRAGSHSISPETSAEKYVSATTDGMGRYGFESVPIGTVELRIAGFYDLFVAHGDRRAQVEVKPREISRLDINLQAMRGLTLRIRATVSGRNVFSEAFVRGPDRGASLRRGVVGDDGWIQVVGLAAGTNGVDLSANGIAAGAGGGPLGYAVHAAFDVEVGEGRQPAIVEREFAGVRVQGTVEHDSSVAATQIQVRAVPLDFKSRVGRSGIATVSCDSQGAFDFPMLLTGKWRFEAVSEGLLASRHELNLTQDTDLKLSLGEVGGSILLRVAEIKGKMRGSTQIGIPIDVRDEQGNLVQSHTEVLGSGSKLLPVVGATHRITSLPSGVLRLTIGGTYGTEEQTVSVTVAAGKETAADLVLWPASTLRFRLPAGDYTAAELETVVLTLGWVDREKPFAIKGARSWRKDSDGRWRLSVHMSRAYTIDVEATMPGRESHVTTFTMTRGEETVHDIVWGTRKE